MNESFSLEDVTPRRAPWLWLTGPYIIVLVAFLALPLGNLGVLSVKTYSPVHLWTNELTDANAAIFDAANNFAGCIPGVLEVLRRQGLLDGTWCLDPHETLSPGQAEEIERVCRACPHLTDDASVREHRDEWLR